MNINDDVGAALAALNKQVKDILERLDKLEKNAPAKIKTVQHTKSPLQRH